MSLPAAYTTRVSDNIVAIDVDYTRPLLASSHLITAGDEAAFVDTGTNHSVPRLLAALAAAGMRPEQVRFLLLTHIHLDHAGGVGALAAALPAAKVIVHPRGARHLIDPTKLIAGAKAVYGESVYAELYGELLPVAADQVQTTDDGETLRLGDRVLTFLHTEGHARHHQCIHDSASSGIFTGDSFGVSYRELDTEQGEFIFPTTTPVQFDPDAAHATIDRLLSLRPDRMFLTHYSQVTDIARLAADLHTALEVFVELTHEHQHADHREHTLAGALFDWLGERLDAHGFVHDLERRHAILDMDCMLNAQGLLHWIDHAA